MKTVVAGALGECVHVAGVSNFLRLAEAAGWRTIFLGPAVSVEQMIEAARREKAELVGVSYRLTPETGERLLGQFAEAASDLQEAGVNFAFGGTPPVAERARKIGFFERIFDGSESSEEVLAYLKGQTTLNPSEIDYPQSTIERIQWKSPWNKRNSQSKGVGCDFSGYRPGCPGKFLPPRKAGCPPNRGRWSARALCTGLSCPVRCQPDRELSTTTDILRYR
jgi:methylmalonyl-CoA mutase cobalamin-binding subunit